MLSYLYTLLHIILWFILFFDYIIYIISYLTSFCISYYIEKCCFWRLTDGTTDPSANGKERPGSAHHLEATSWRLRPSSGQNINNPLSSFAHSNLDLKLKANDVLCQLVSRVPRRGYFEAKDFQWIQRDYNWIQLTSHPELCIPSGKTICSCLSIQEHHSFATKALQFSLSTAPKPVFAFPPNKTQHFVHPWEETVPIMSSKSEIVWKCLSVKLSSQPKILHFLICNELLLQPEAGSGDGQMTQRTTVTPTTKSKSRAPVWKSRRPAIQAATSGAIFDNSYGKVTESGLNSVPGESWLPQRPCTRQGETWWNRHFWIVLSHDFSMSRLPPPLLPP